MRAPWVIAALLALAGCGSTPFDVAQPGEMKRGEPGLFSGPDGVFTIFAPSSASPDP